MIHRDHRAWRLTQLVFAEDTGVVAESAEQLQCLVTELERVCETSKLRLKKRKSNVVIVGREEVAYRLEVDTNGKIMKSVSFFFKYL